MVSALRDAPDGRSDAKRGSENSAWMGDTDWSEAMEEAIDAIEQAAEAMNTAISELERIEGVQS